MSLKQTEIKFAPRIKLNHNMYNDRCITGMCIHVITVTSDGPWTQHQGLRGHIPFIPCILVNTAEECEHIEKKNLPIRLKECRWPRMGGGLLLSSAIKRGFCDIQHNKGLGKCYHWFPKLTGELNSLKLICQNTFM